MGDAAEKGFVSEHEDYMERHAVAENNDQNGSSTEFPVNANELSTLADTPKGVSSSLSKKDIENDDKLNDADQMANSILSDQESETEQRNTSTSNAGESEYESANEEDIAESDNENSPKTGVSAFKSPIANDQDSGKCPKTDAASINNTTNAVDAEENFDKPQVVNAIIKGFLSVNNETIEKFSFNNDEEEDTNEFDHEPAEERVLNQIRRRKKLNNLSDDENSEELDDGSEDVTNGIDEDAEESSDENAIKLVPDNERENGDGQESENQDSKSSKAIQSEKVGKKGEIEDKRNPQYIPRKGPFYEHDDRINEDLSRGATEESPKSSNENDEIDAEKVKARKRLMASMKLCSDEMIDEDLDAEVRSSKSVSKEKIHDISTQSVESLENDVANVKVDSKSPREAKKKPLWDSKDRWSHDKFNMDDQKPKSRDELINVYGYDIRNENDAPKLQRRSKYGKGPQKYSRRSEDENAYAKKTLRKVIVKPSRSRAEETGEFQQEIDSPPIVKKDQVFSNKQTPKPERKVSRENLSRPSYSKPNNNYPDSSNRIHENRVFVNKSGYSQKYGKNEKSRSSQESFNNSTSLQVNESIEPRRENRSPERVVNDKPKELFTNEDFPELVSSAKAQPSAEPSKENKGIIYYQNSPMPVKSEGKSIRDTQQSNNNLTESKESNFDSDPVKPNQSLPVVKSQLYENSRYSRSRNNNYSANHEYNNNANWNNNRPVNSGKPSQYTSNQQVKKPLASLSSASKEESSTLNETNESISNDSRPKRYSSIRQQQQRTLNVPPNPSSTAQTAPFTAVCQANATTSQQYITLNADGAPANIIPAETKNAYYEPPVNASEISHGQSTSLMQQGSAPSHHHPAHAHNYAPINGPAPAGGSAAGTAAYIPAATPMMAYYDPNAATAQPTGTSTSGLQAPIGLTQAYFTTDQTGTPQPNYYLTAADLSTVAYHPAYHLPTNYPQPLPSHHSHQSHVTNRYLNTAPASAPSAESSRYLQTVPSTQSSTPILVAGQTYQTTIQTAFPSGYPQFPPPSQSGSTPAMGTSSPLPAGYPNVPMGNSSTNASVASAQQQTPSGYPELYRGGITYYDIQSQQQAMRHMQNLTQQPQQQPRRSKLNHHSPAHDPDNNDLNVDSDAAPKGSKHSSSNKNEISVSN